MSERPLQNTAYFITRTSSTSRSAPALRRTRKHSVDPYSAHLCIGRRHSPCCRSVLLVRLNGDQPSSSQPHFQSPWRQNRDTRVGPSSSQSRYLPSRPVVLIRSDADQPTAAKRVTKRVINHRVQQGGLQGTKQQSVASSMIDSTQGDTRANRRTGEQASNHSILIRMNGNQPRGQLRVSTIIEKGKETRSGPAYNCPPAQGGTKKIVENSTTLFLRNVS